MTVTLRSVQRPALAASVTRYTGIANGDVPKYDGSGLVAAVADRPLGIVVGDIPATNPMARFAVAVDGDCVYDDALASQTVGALIYSDGDGTYSAVAPTAAAGTLKWILGTVKNSDANGTEIELNIQALEDGAA